MDYNRFQIFGNGNGNVGGFEYPPGDSLSIYHNHDTDNRKEGHHEAVKEKVEVVHNDCMDKKAPTRSCKMDKTIEQKIGIVHHHIGVSMLRQYLFIMKTESTIWILGITRNIPRAPHQPSLTLESRKKRVHTFLRNSYKFV